MLDATGPLSFLGRLIAEQSSGIEALTLAFAVAAVVALGGFALYLLLVVFFWAGYLHRSVPLRRALGLDDRKRSSLLPGIALVAITALALGLVITARSGQIRATLATPVEIGEHAAAFPLRAVPNEAELGRPLEVDRVPLSAVLPAAIASGAGDRAVRNVLEREELAASRLRARAAYGLWMPALGAALALVFLGRLAFVRALRLDREPQAAADLAAVASWLPLVAVCSAVLAISPATLADASIVRGVLASAAYAEPAADELGTALDRAFREQDRLYRNLRLLRTEPDEVDAKTVWDLLGSTQSSLHNLRARFSALSADQGLLSERLARLEPATEALREDLARVDEELRSELASTGDQLQAEASRLRARLEEAREAASRDAAALGRRLDRSERATRDASDALSQVENGVAELRRVTSPKLAQLDNFLRELPRLESRLTELESERSSADGRMAALERARSELERMLRDHAERLEALEP